MKKLIFLLFILLLSIVHCSLSIGQTYKLCGVWFGYPYSAGITQQNLTEIIIITQVGQSVIALKYTGDSAVIKGSPTFFIPEYTLPNASGYFINGSIIGWPHYVINPNTGCRSVNGVNIIDSIHINTNANVGGGPNFIKATRAKIDSLHINLDSLLYCFNKNNVSKGLSGVWLGGPYDCETTQNQTETIIITQIGQSVVASKYTGDSCGPKGSVTFFIPEYNQPNVTAYFITGWINQGYIYPNYFCDPLAFTVTDSAHVQVGNYHYTKATAAQMDSMKINVDSLQGCCGVHVGIKEVAAKEGVSVYPNPTGGQLRITNYGLKIKRVEVTNLLGEVVKSITNYESGITVDLSKQPDGVYFVKVWDDSGGMVVKKVLKITN